MGAPAAHRRRDGADLGREDRQPPRMEGLAERQRHLAVAVPARLDDARLEAARGRAPAAARRRWRWHGRPAPARRAPPPAGEARRRGPPPARRAAGRCRTRQVDAGDARQQRRRQQPDHAGADDQRALAGQRPRVPEDVERRLHVRRQHRAVVRHGVGDGDAHRGRRQEQVLVRVEAEDAAAEQRRAARPRRRPWRSSRTSRGRGSRPPSAAPASPRTGSPARGPPAPGARCRATGPRRGCGPAPGRGRAAAAPPRAAAPAPGATVQSARAAPHAPQTPGRARSSAMSNSTSGSRRAPSRRSAARRRCAPPPAG